MQVTCENITWVIERHIFEEDKELALIEEVKKQGGLIEVIDPLSKRNFPWEQYGWELENKPVIFRGSLNIGKKAKQQEWYPGVICNQKAFNCSTYYTYWGKWMLNEDYMLLPMAELKRKASDSCFKAGYAQKAFIRPDSGMKQFAGGVFNLSDLSLLKDIEAETLVLIAPVKKVNKEWRFVIADNKVITGSQYYEKGEYVTEQNVDFNNKAAYFLESILEKITWQPDPIYTVDVCESEDEYHILELNSFSCSALYNCDTSKVVEAANKVAIKDWREVND